MYKNMAEILHDEKCGDYEINHFSISDKNLRAMIDGIPPGNYVRLMYKGVVLMSDTPMEKRTNISFCSQAHGDVLIGGLGIGMIILAIQDKEEVDSITVLEISSDLISMIKGQVPFNEKVKILQANVFDWRPGKGQRFDCIYMDIWPSINSDVHQEEMKPLKRKYGHYLKPIEESPKRFNNCWAEWNAKTNHSLR